MIAPLLLLGIALGPHGMALLSAGAIAFIDPAVPVALGALGALLGLSAGTRRSGDRRLFAVASAEALVTAVSVAIPFAILLPVVAPALTLPAWLVATLAAVCAATALAVPAGSPAAPGDHSGRVIELDALLAVAAGGVLLAAIREPSPMAALSLTGQACVATLVLASSSWLLLSHAASDTAERVFTVAALLLVGGAADYLSLSALLGGVLAGMFWQGAGGPARELIRRDALYVQHPLLVLLLVVAGARAELTLPAIALGLAYALLRTIGRLGGAWSARWLAGAFRCRDLGARLLPPGVFGVAFALNTVREYGPDLSILLSVIVVGTAASELFAGTAWRTQAAAA